ncbi:MAG: 16S rRNA (guanine(966)-N(2))-methyltransferase RsmD [Nitratireductor sp.]
MRIVGGEFRGRRLATPQSNKIRPTTDRTRESLFNILNHKVAFEDARVLDLFAGTGALGLEAVSRGAKYVLFIEESAEGRGLLRSNVETFGLQGKSKIWRRDATKLGPSGNMGQFDIIFMDPPYGKSLAEGALAQLIEGDWLSKDATIIVEESAGNLPQNPTGYRIVDERAFGETSIGIFELEN